MAGRSQLRLQDTGSDILQYWGPRIGLAYSINPKTVVRAGFAQVFTQAGGVGGRGGAANGTGWHRL